MDTPTVEADFTPQHDITAFELAIIIKRAILGIVMTRERFESLPPSILRHLTVREPKDG